MGEKAYLSGVLHRYMSCRRLERVRMYNVGPCVDLPVQQAVLTSVPRLQPTCSRLPPTWPGRQARAFDGTVGSRIILHSIPPRNSYYSPLTT